MERSHGQIQTAVKYCQHKSAMSDPVSRSDDSLQVVIPRKNYKGGCQRMVPVLGVNLCYQ